MSFDLWRRMVRADLNAVNELADRVHVAYPEDPEIFEERFRLYPGGCFVCEDRGRFQGYAISHPWRRHTVPALNSLLRRLPESCDTYYIHDIALASDGRGAGHGSTIVDLIKRHARDNRFESISLVAVNRSTPFWERHGFLVQSTPSLREKLRSYDPQAAYLVCPL